MSPNLKHLLLPAVLSVVAQVPLTLEARAYPIDCAILLCLAGGWPASTECTLAKAEFIRRITPYPVEPPLQIWRCPMGTGLPALPSATPQIIIGESHDDEITTEGGDLQPTTSVEAIGSGADVDIGGAAFDFVRSIDVFQVRASQRESGDGECNRMAIVRRGHYGPNGQFFWGSSVVRALPPAFQGASRYGDHCPSVNIRSMFVDWEDYKGTYGFEQVNY
ncbi:hypothetical protein [Marinovum sp.]|uniref:hypothetical protein n=1 Tax=Marinovum sp. TaxID=2024839 RepID=UPI002B26FAAA|nr:hypothetical protein [Marinovum sp.]